MKRNDKTKHQISVSVLLCALACSCSIRGEKTRAPTPKENLQASAHGQEDQALDLKGKRARTLVTHVNGIAKYLKYSPEERDLLDRQGFVVTRAPEPFGRVPERIYDRIYQRDLPVLITSDSILYAFHRQYVDFLETLEGSQLTSLVERTLAGTRDSLLRAITREEVDAQMAQELDVYLTVALNLLNKKQQAPILPNTPPGRVEDILERVQSEQRAELEIFNRTQEDYDYGFFMPRGHYTESAELQRYFRCVTWLSRVPLEILEYPNRRPQLNRRAFDTAATLSWLIHESGSEGEFLSYQKILDTLVGPGDDDTPAPLIEFLKHQQVKRANEILKISDEQINTWLRKDTKKRSRIATHSYLKPRGRPRKPNPRNFLMIGARFTIDSNIFANLVFDRLVDPKRPNKQIHRMLPKTLDVIAALGNPRAKVHLQKEFKAYPYEPALDQIKQELAKLPASEWSKNLHSAWLAAIASLHKRPDDPRLPKVFRSAPWKDKVLQTQLASWAELRHDHILYAKQSFTGAAGCEFPDAYVEPVPHFYSKMNEMLDLLALATETVTNEGLMVPEEIDLRIEHFMSVLDNLEDIARKELAHEPLETHEMRFLKQAVEHEASGYGPKRWDGWYPKLIGINPVGTFKPTIADVHTQPKNPVTGEAAKILHAGTGAFEVATVLVDCPGKKKCAYVGPVSSFYELVPPNQERLTDEAWKILLRTRKVQQTRPDWIKSFRLPDEFTDEDLTQEKRALEMLNPTLPGVHHGRR